MTPDTKPPVVTVATDALLLDHVPAGVASVNVTGLPTHIAVVPTMAARLPPV